MPLIDPLSIVIETSTIPVHASRPSGPRRRILTQVPNTNDYILEIDYSSLSSFMVCPKQGENLMVKGRVFAHESAATSFGRCFHLAEELRLRHGYSPATVEAQRELVAKHFTDNPVPSTEYRNASRMFDTLDKYNSMYGASDGWPGAIVKLEGQPLIERPFKIELCTIPVGQVIPYHPKDLVVGYEKAGIQTLQIDNIHVLFTGRIDLVIEDKGLWVVDHKTTSRGGAEFHDYFNLSLQTRGYALACQKLGIPVIGLILNAVIGRPPTKTGTGIEFLREFYVYSPDLLEDCEQSVISHITHFVHCLVSGYFPQISLSFKSPCVGCGYTYNCRLPRAQRSADLSSDTYCDVTWNPMSGE